MKEAEVNMKLEEEEEKRKEYEKSLKEPQDPPPSTPSPTSSFKNSPSPPNSFKTSNKTSPTQTEYMRVKTENSTSGSSVGSGGGTEGGGEKTMIDSLQEDPQCVPCVAVIYKDQALPFVIKRVLPSISVETRVGCAAYPYFTSFYQALQFSKDKQLSNQHDPFILIINRMVNYVCGKVNT